MSQPERKPKWFESFLPKGGQDEFGERAVVKNKSVIDVSSNGTTSVPPEELLKVLRQRYAEIKDR
jgi:hypothetical protein